MILCPVNLADSAALGASPSLLSALPVANLQNRARELVARGESGHASQTILGSWANSVEADTLVLWRHNLTGGTWSLTLYSGANQAGSVVYSVSGLIYDQGEFDQDFPGPWPYRWTAYQFPVSMFRSFSLTFEVSGPAYFEAARLFIGRSWSPDTPWDWRDNLRWATNGTATRTAGGSVRETRGSKWRELQFNLSFLDTDEATTIREIQRLALGSGEVWVSLYPGQGGGLERDYSMLCSLPPDGANGSARWNPLFWQDGFKLVES